MNTMLNSQWFAFIAGGVWCVIVMAFFHWLDERALSNWEPSEKCRIVHSPSGLVIIFGFVGLAESLVMILTIGCIRPQWCNRLLED